MRLRIALVFFFVLSFVSIIAAQTNTENFAQLEFNFSNPGARAIGIGGAFISIADDATAAESNPAGLTTLVEPEVSFEFKATNFSREIFNFDFEGDQSNFTLIDREFSNSIVSPSFLSAVVPLERVTLSAFRHELVNFESSFSTNTTFVPGFTTGFGYFPVESDFEMKVVNWGGAAGYQINEMVSIGGAVGLSQIDLKSTLLRFDFFTDDDVRSRFTIDDTGSDYFFNIGILVRPAPNFALGAIFKRRPKFAVIQTLEKPEQNLVETREINFNIPSAIGIGLSYRPMDVLTLSVDAVRISYSDVTEDFVISEATETFDSDDFAVDDGVEIHVGGEYVTFVDKVGLVFRGGFFTEPDNRITYVGETTGEPDLTASTAELFRPGDSEVHVTFGLGVLVSENIQLDLAGKLSETRDEFVASFVYRL